MNYSDAIAEKPFERPSVYDGIKGYDFDPETVSKKIDEDVEHLYSHAEILEKYRVKQALEGTDLNSDVIVEVDNVLQGIYTAIEEARSTDPYNELEVHQLNIRVIAVENQVHDTENRHGIILDKHFSGGQKMFI